MATNTAAAIIAHDRNASGAATAKTISEAVVSITWVILDLSSSLHQTRFL
jgi:hypothetical protein